MSQSKKQVTFGVFGHYGNENLGDEAIIEAVIQNIRHRLINAKIICFSVNPEDTAKRYGVPAYPIRYMSKMTISHAQQVLNTLNANNASEKVTQETNDQQVQSQSGIKEILIKIPLIGNGLKATSYIPYYAKNWKIELEFLMKCRRIMKDVDVLLISLGKPPAMPGGLAKV